MSLVDKLERIDITNMTDFRIGNAQNQEGGTGCTVIISEDGAVCGVDVRGGGPATRETDRLSPLCKLDYNHGIVLSGGSAYGLDASGGVMQYLEENGIGYETGAGLVPLVSGASIYDLNVGDSKCRPDKAMGYEACKDAFDTTTTVRSGNYGGGTGASVGKFGGPTRRMKGGLGSYAFKYDKFEIGAVVIVNALGDIYNMEDGSILAGVLSEDGKRIVSAEDIVLDKIYTEQDFFNKNTTIGCIITNATLTNSQATKVSSLAQNGLARVIWPVHTSADGDSVFTMSSGKIDVDTDVVGSIASEVLAFAINDAIKNAESAYGIKSMLDFRVRENG